MKCSSNACGINFCHNCQLPGQGERGGRRDGRAWLSNVYCKLANKRNGNATKRVSLFVNCVCGHPRSWHLSQCQCRSLPHEPLKLPPLPLPTTTTESGWLPWHYWHAAWVRSRHCQPLALHLREMQKSLWGRTLINCNCNCNYECDWRLPTASVAATATVATPTLVINAVNTYFCGCKKGEEQQQQQSSQPACCLLASNFVAQPKFVACLNIVLLASCLAPVLYTAALPLLLVTVVIPVLSLHFLQSDEAYTHHRFWIFVLQHCGIL